MLWVSLLRRFVKIVLEVSDQLVPIVVGVQSVVAEGLGAARSESIKQVDQVRVFCLGISK
jgi:hypothetical protein